MDGFKKFLFWLILVTLTGDPVIVSAACPPPRVLFVCPAGTVKSAIAREVFKRRAAERGIAIQVHSRGVHPEDHVSAGLAEHLSAEGIDPRADPVQTYSPADPAQADLVIAFDEAAQAPGMTKARLWDIPSFNSDYAAARAALGTRIDALLDEIQRRSCAP